MRSRPARVFGPSALLIALAAVVASAPAHQPDRISAAQLGDPEQGGLPPNYIFYVDEATGGNYVLDAIADDGPSLKMVISDEGVPSEVMCGVGSREVAKGSRWPEFEFSPESIKDRNKLPHGEVYAAPCKVTAKVTMKKGVAKLLGFRGTSFEVKASPAPVYPTFARGEPRNARGYLPRPSHFHFTLPSKVRKKLEPVMQIDKLAFSAVVTGPESHGSRKVEVKPERSYWVQSGGSCFTEDRNLYVRRRASKPHCPKNKDGANLPAPVNWYKGG